MNFRIFCFAILLVVVASEEGQRCSIFQDCPNNLCCKGMMFRKTCEKVLEGDWCSSYCPCFEGECIKRRCVKSTTTTEISTTTLSTVASTNSETAETILISETTTISAPSEAPTTSTPPPVASEESQRLE